MNSMLHWKQCEISMHYIQMPHAASSKNCQPQGAYGTLYI